MCVRVFVYELLSRDVCMVPCVCEYNVSVCGCMCGEVGVNVGACVNDIGCGWECVCVCVNWCVYVQNT